MTDDIKEIVIISLVDINKTYSLLEYARVPNLKEHGNIIKYFDQDLCESFIKWFNDLINIWQCRLQFEITTRMSSSAKTQLPVRITKIVATINMHSGNTSTDVGSIHLIEFGHRFKSRMTILVSPTLGTRFRTTSIKSGLWINTTLIDKFNYESFEHDHISRYEISDIPALIGKIYFGDIKFNNHTSFDDAVSEILLYN